MADRLPACAGLITSAVTFTCEMVAQLKNVKESPSVSNSVPPVQPQILQLHMTTAEKACAEGYPK